jgi:hypothetical protein
VVASEAAAAAISAKQYNTALEWLEQGHSIVWNQFLQLRTPFDALALDRSMQKINDDVRDGVSCGNF